MSTGVHNVLSAERVSEACEHATQAYWNALTEVIGGLPRATPGGDIDFSEILGYEQVVAALAANDVEVQ